MPELIRLFRFALASGLAALVHLSVAETLVIYNWVYSAFTANMLAFVPAVVVSYIGQRTFAFRSPGKVSRFLALAALGFGLNNMTLLGALKVGIAPSLSLLISAAASPIMMYWGCRYLVFSPLKEPGTVPTRA